MTLFTKENKMIILPNKSNDEIRDFIDKNSLRNDFETLELSFSEEEDVFILNPQNQKQELEIRRIAYKYNANII
jgi:hypothetical protein